MSTVIALIRKGLLDVRWMLGLICLTAFGLCWLFVFFTHRIETRARFPVEISTIELEMRFWENFPIFLLMLSIWSIARGSAAVAGEIEKGTMDLIMSRPVGRSGYLFTHVLVGLFGLLLIVTSMVAGNLTGAHYNSLKNPPSFLMLARPATNLAAFGWAVYGYTFFLSAIDQVRWRPILIGSVATFAAWILHIVSNIPQLDEGWKWIDKLSIFRAIKLAEVATKGETFEFNLGILGGIGAIGIILGFLFFSGRDLPSNS